LKSITLTPILFLSLLGCGQPSISATAQPSAHNVEANHVELSTVTLHVEGMTCRGCENSIKSTLKKKAGIREVAASHSENSVVVTFERDRITIEEIKAVISDLGYQIK
jgi:copper chaperone CopZ